MSLFDPITLRGVTMPNRIVKSAMAEGCADADGRPGPGLSRMYARWARGGVGLAITGMATVRGGYAFTDREVGLHADALVEPLREVTRAFHEAGEGKIFAQLCHAPPQMPRAKAKRLGAVAPSAGFCPTNFLYNRAISDGELRALVRDFGAAARRAREAGFDGVQVHAAHGYLPSRMLSPRFNRRSDAWGGSLDGRLRFLREILESVRAAVGENFPVAVKLNAHDGVSGGLEVEERIRMAKRLEGWGADAFEISAGVADVGLGCYPNKGGIPREAGKAFLRQELPWLRPIIPMLGPYMRWIERTIPMTEAYFYDIARRFADALTVPVICVGGIRSSTVAERILSESSVAMVSLARPLVREPGLPKRWREGRGAVAQCSSCNECFVRLGLGEPLRCWNAARPPAAE